MAFTLPEHPATLNPAPPPPMDTEHQPSPEDPMRRVALFALPGVILGGCAVATLTAGGRPGQVPALALSIVVAVGGVALRKRPGA
jgi:hypothetical protein